MEQLKKTTAEEIEVGGKVQSKCGACKELTMHTVISMEGNKPAQVCCQNCERYHKYRPAAKPKVTRAKKNPDLEEWLMLSPDWAEINHIAYGISKSFKVNDIVKHRKFGLGQVRQLVPPNKMRVLFESGLKLMLCGK